MERSEDGRHKWERTRDSCLLGVGPWCMPVRAVVPGEGGRGGERLGRLRQCCRFWRAIPAAGRIQGTRAAPACCRLQGIAMHRRSHSTLLAVMNRGRPGCADVPLFSVRRMAQLRLEQATALHSIADRSLAGVERWVCRRLCWRPLDRERCCSKWVRV